MGENSIDRGERDNWTLTPRYIDTLKNAISVMQRNADVLKQGGETMFDSIYHRRQTRDPRGYIISSGQKDFFSAVKFVNALIESGISVEKFKNT